MAEPGQVIFTYKEVGEALLKKEGIHEGLWALYIKFGLAALNVGGSDSELRPTALIPILELGLQKADKETNISVDAAKANLRPKKSISGEGEASAVTKIRPSAWTTHPGRQKLTSEVTLDSGQDHRGAHLASEASGWRPTESPASSVGATTKTCQAAPSPNLHEAQGPEALSGES